jgi:mono/diheme cytochrome c family protein
MNRAAVAAGMVLAIGAAAYVALNRADVSAGSAPVIAGAPASADVLARGEYLTRAADCVACHTVPDSHRPFAGGVAFKLPFGTIYSSNITADPRRGIGGWSDDEFVRAVREGVRNDGRHLYPAFPYTSYTRLSRSDVLAIKAYLFSLPAIDQVNRANELAFPFNQRWAMGFWNAAFFKSQRFVPDPSRSAQWNGGAYLATALGHCRECHTPRNLGYGLDHGHELAGQELQGWRAYNITPDPTYGIGSWTAAETARYLRTGHVDGRASASGPMGEAVAHSLQFLTDEDMAALVAYLRSLPPDKGEHPIEIDSQAPPPAAAAPVQDASGAQARGFELFEGACASCHQWDGSGRQSSYAALFGTRGVNDASGANVTQAILQGVNLRIGDSYVYMPAFGRAYSDTEVAALANYVVSRFGGKPATVTARDVAERRAL